MANAEKVAAVAELTERFKDSSGAVLTEYRGLTVAQLAELRRSLGDELSSLLSGPSAIAFVDGDVVEAAKGLRDFARANPLLVIKGGVLDGKAMSPSEITKLADLEPREVLLAKLAGAMKASLAGAAATFNALPVQMAQLAEALRVKRAAAEGGAPEASTAEASTAEASTPEASAPEGGAPEGSSEAAEAADAAPGDEG
jgi:large subunit ribosomal protein L10